MPRKQTRGARNIAWIEKYIKVPEGKLVGQPLKLRPWQKKFLKKVYDNPHGTRLAILSFGKKNGKTALAACLLLLHLCGPEARANSQLPSTAQSKEQAAVLYKLAAKMVRFSVVLSDVVVTRDTMKELYCPELGTVYKALSSEASTAHGQSPVFSVHDELGQVKGPVSELYTAIETAMGAHDDPMSIIISTQAATDGDLLSILIDDAMAGHDPTVVVSLYTADEKVNPFSQKALKQANPAFGDFLNKKELQKQQLEAKRMPTKEPLFRNYLLNQRVEAHASFITRTLWQECEGDVVESFKGYPVYAGLDLSETRDLTALVLVALIEGVWHVKPMFWLPQDGLADKAKTDRVPYDLWEKQGFIQAAPGRTIEYLYVAQYMRGLFDELDIRAVAFDRWNWRHFKPWLAAEGFTEAELESFIEFGQGFQSMSPALRDTEAAILNKKLLHDGNPVLKMCAANAVVQVDPAGNKKLTKSKSRGRIDGMVALVQAMAMAATHEDEVNVKSFWDHNK